VVNGRKTTITEAEAALGYPVPLPSTSAAGEDNLDGVWMNTDTRHVGLEEPALVYRYGTATLLAAAESMP
jgi:hypothetical protein